MKSGFVHTAQPALSDSFSADQIPGNRLKIKRDVTVYLNHPGSNEKEIWKAGFLSPPVYSWVQRDGNVYWMIGELSPRRYVKHEKNDFELIPDSGGAQFIKKDREGSLFDLGFKNFEQNLKDSLKVMLPVAAVGLGIYALIPLTPMIMKKMMSKDK